MSAVPGGTVDLLWTGGWDSTFRLLQLLWTTEAHVRPHYLVDEDRRSLTLEIEAMREIRDGIDEARPEAADRMLPTEYSSYLATEVPSRFREWSEEWNRHGRLGPQYAVLASYALENGLQELELGIFGGEPPLSRLTSRVEVRETGDRRVKVLPDDVGAPEALFGRFAFPLLGCSKLRMEREAREMGVLPLLEQSWFCHDPVWQLPCGACHPCGVAREEGLDRRVGRVGPLLHRIRWRFRE